MHQDILVSLVKHGRVYTLSQNSPLTVVAKNPDLDAVRSALCRLIIIEQVDEATLKGKCEYLLRKRHRIPIDKTEEVIAKKNGAIYCPSLPPY